MFRLIWIASVHVRYFLRRYMPSKIVLDLIRTRRGLKFGRRILNHALFKRITIDDEEQVSYEPTDAVAGVFAHLNTEVPDTLTAETNLPRDHAGQVSNFSTYVDLRRFELLTSSMRTRRATNCAIGP